MKVVLVNLKVKTKDVFPFHLYNIFFMNYVMSKYTYMLRLFPPNAIVAGIFIQTNQTSGQVSVINQYTVWALLRTHL